MFLASYLVSCNLGGLSLAPHLIKEVVLVLQKDIPSIHTFSTLSPIPTFTKWLSKVLVDILVHVFMLHDCPYCPVCFFR